jgi:WD40 repeat protein
MARVWDLASGTLLHTLPAGHDGAPQFAVAFSPDGQRLATSGQDREPAVWDLQTGQRALALTGHAEPLIPDAWLFVGIQDITYSPDGALLATAGADATARIWDASSGRQLRVLEHPMKLNSVRFSPDGKRLATGGDDFTAKIWDVASGELLATLRGHGLRVWSAVFSPDGRRLATAGQDTTAKIWDLATGEEILTLKGHSSTVACLAYSPDGSRLVTVSDAAARIWDTSDGRELLTIYAGNTAFWGAAFHPDGKRLVVADLGGFVHQYTLQIDDLMRLARGRVTRGLTPAELRRYLHAP